MSFRFAGLSFIPFRLSLLVMMVLAGDVAVNAQTVVDPRNAQFNASPDHNATNPDGSPALDHYELEFYMVGASQPFQTVGLGKPAPDGTGTVLVDFSALLVPIPTGGIIYNAAVAAIGPGGRASSALSVDSFEFSSLCTYTISPTAIALTSAGGTGSVIVTAPNGCAWTATESASWLNINSGASGSGNGTVSYSAIANATSSSQNTTLTVAGQAVSVTEAGAACTFTVSPTTIALTGAGGTGNVAVSAPGGCAWTASETANWLSITSGASGSGNGTVAYSATANASSSAQNTTLTVAGQAVSVTEAAAACALGVSPTAITVGSGGGAGSVTVSVPGGCAWTATSNASWLVVTSGASGYGNGSVVYSATVNPAAADRNATLTIGGQAVVVTEAKRLAAPTRMRIVRP